MVSTLNKLLFLVVIIFMFSNCRNDKHNIHQKKLENNPANISELFYQAYYFSINKDERFFEICDNLNDSIILENSPFWLSSVNEEYPNEKEVDWGIVLENQFPKGVPDRLFFYVCIEDTNTIYVNRELCDISSIHEKANMYIFHPDSTVWHITNRKYSIDNLGEIEASYVAAFFVMDVKRKNGLTGKEWELFFSCLHELMVVFENERDSLSFKTWGKRFLSLSYEEKVSIIKVVNYRFIVSFDQNCRFYSDYFYQYLDSINKNMSNTTMNEILDIH